ncbi:MAG TPA: BamA/TamA family outer membrane protein [Polyangia bacterium]
MPSRAPAGLVLLALGGALVLAAGAARADAIEEPGEEPPAAPVPRADWFTLETPHFAIHFYSGEGEFAERVAHFAERAYRLNTRYLNWRPSGRVVVTLSDVSDSANGSASSVPYNFINAFGVPPDSLDELNDFDDYVKLLITHEFTHVVHLDTILTPCALIYNTLLGKTFAPNLAEPVWFIEGMAVLMESRQTTAGRLRSSFYDMHLRVPFMEGRLFGLDQVTAIPSAYPQGTAAYLYGSSLLRYVEDRYGPHKIREISHRYADTCIPGGINRTALKAVGRGYAGIFGAGLFDDWRRSVGHRYALEIEEAERRPLTSATRITWDAPSPRSEGPGARFFADGTLVYHRSNNDQAPAYVHFDPGSGTKRLIADMLGGGPAAPTPDGQALVFQRLNFVSLPLRLLANSDLAWNDLYRLDVATGTIRQLTNGARAHEPDVSPDGKWIVCVLVGTGTRRLALVPIEGGEPRPLMPGAPGLAFTPAFSPDGRLIAYSRWKPGGFRDIHIYDLATATDRALSVDRAMDIDPRFSPDGRYVLYSSDRSGINNIYAYELSTRRLFQVTNVLSGAFQPAVSPDRRRLVYTGFTTDGFDLWTMPYDPATFLPAKPFANARLDSPSDPDAETDSPDAAPEDAAAAPFPERIVPYVPWKYLYPHQWTVGLLDDPFGLGQTLQIQTSVVDPASIHSFSFDLLFPTSGSPSGVIAYTYARLWPVINLSLSKVDLITNGLIVDNENLNYTQRTVTFSASTSLPVLRTPDASGDVVLAYDYSVYGPISRIPVGEPTGGITIKPQTGPAADLRLSWSFSNAHSWQYSISNQEGRGINLTLRLSDPTLGGKFTMTEIDWSWTEYATPPWARLHALAFITQGGFSMGDHRQFFSLGGYGDQDVLRSILLKQQAFAFLRGYPANVVSGDSFLVASAEYRAPLLWIERGYQTFPLYLRRIWGAAFVDAGNAFQGPFHVGGVKTDAGLETHLLFSGGWYLEPQITLGYAHGFQSGGGNQLYFVASATF